MRTPTYMVVPIPVGPCSATHSRSASSARSRSSQLPPHQYAMSCVTQQSTHVQSGHKEQPSVVNGCGGRSAPRVWLQIAAAFAASSRAASG